MPEKLTRFSYECTNLIPTVSLAHTTVKSMQFFFFGNNFLKLDKEKYGKVLEIHCTTM